MPAFPVFQTLDVRERNIRYKKEDYPEAVRLLETSIIANTELYHICVQDLDVQAAYVAAFREVFDNLDELLESITD